MGRPLLPLDQLKNPRHIRRSTTVASIITSAPEPSKAMRLQWKGILDMCIVSILSQPSRDNNRAKKNRVRIRFEESWKPPKDFPIGRVTLRENGWKVLQYNPEDVIRWAYMYKLTPDSPAMLYEKRSKHINNMTRLENSAEIDVDKEYLSIYYEHLDSILNEILGE
jgi:hypothetical protein